MTGTVGIEERVRRGVEVRLANRYVLRRVLGSGGMAVVWEAEDAVLGRRVAVKMLPASAASSDRAIRRFEREARAAARLSDPRIAAVYDFGTDDGVPFLVMELIDGQTLADRLHRSGRLAPSEAVTIAASVADALEVAHRAGIVHRDVTPGNVMLTRAGGIKVMDFGIAASTADALGEPTSRGFGTPGYLSPEQARGEPATPKSDVYALGAVLYEMLAGRPPFVRATPVATAVAHLHDEPEPLGELAPGVPASLASVCAMALAKDPSGRPSSAAAFAAALRGTEVSLPSIVSAPASDPTDPLLERDLPTAHLPGLALPGDSTGEIESRRPGGTSRLPVVAMAESGRSSRPEGPRPVKVAALVVAASLGIWIVLALVFGGASGLGSRTTDPLRHSSTQSVAVSTPPPSPAHQEPKPPKADEGKPPKDHEDEGKHLGEG